MTIAFACVLIAGLLPIVAAGIAKFGFKDFDNSNPRQWLAKQTGFRARANAAQANTFESIPFFFAAIAIAAITQAPQDRIDFLAVIYVLARIAFIVCYVADWPKLRTAVWTIALATIIAIFFQI